MRLKNKIAFITGGNSGIGLATAKIFANEGAKIAIVGRNQETLDAAKAEIGENLLPIRVDVSDINAIQRAVELTKDAFGILESNTQP